MTETIEKKSKWGKVGKVSIYFLVILVCAYAGLAQYFGITSAANAYKRNRDAAKQAGLWFDAADARSFYEVSDQDNGAILLGDYKKAIHAFLQLPKDMPEKKYLAEFAKLEPYIPTLKRAAARKKIQFRKVLKNPYDGIEQALNLSTTVSEFSKRAEFAVKQNERTLGHDLLVIAAQLSIHITDEPDYIRTRIGAADAIEQVIRILIPVYGHDPYWRSVFGETMEILDHSYDLRSYIKFRHWMNIWSGQIVYGDTSMGTLQDLGLKPEDSLPSKYLLGKFTPRYGTAVLSRLHEIYAAVWNGLPNNPDDTEGLVKSLTQMRVTSTYPDLSYELAADADFDFITLGRLMDVESAQRNVLLQAIALIKPNAKPENGLPLPGRYRADVRGGQIHLIREAKGWIIYSVGRNGKDDHARPLPAIIDDFIVHLTPKTIDPKESTRPKTWPLGTGGIG